MRIYSSVKKLRLVWNNNVIQFHQGQYDFDSEVTKMLKFFKGVSVLKAILTDIKGKQINIPKIEKQVKRKRIQKRRKEHGSPDS